MYNIYKQHMPYEEYAENNQLYLDSLPDRYDDNEEEQEEGD